MAFEQAGADVVYAEGLNGPHELRALAEALEQQGVRGLGVANPSPNPIPNLNPNQALEQQGVRLPLMLAQVERPGILLLTTYYLLLTTHYLLPTTHYLLLTTGREAGHHPGRGRGGSPARLLP